MTWNMHKNSFFEIKFHFCYDCLLLCEKRDLILCSEEWYNYNHGRKLMLDISSISKLSLSNFIFLLRFLRSMEKSYEISASVGESIFCTFACWANVLPVTPRSVYLLLGTNTFMNSHNFFFILLLWSRHALKLM